LESGDAAFGAAGALGAVVAAGLDEEPPWSDPPDGGLRAEKVIAKSSTNERPVVAWGAREVIELDTKLVYPVEQIGVVENHLAVGLQVGQSGS
jgi:hypothetical protein